MAGSPESPIFKAVRKFTNCTLCAWAAHKIREKYPPVCAQNMVVLMRISKTNAI